MTTTPAPGIYDYTFAQYCDIDAFNNSAGKHLNKSGAHCLAYQQGRLDKDTDALKLGRILHTAIFEPRKFASIPMLPFKDRRTDAAKDWCKINPVHLTEKDKEDVQAIVKAVYAHKEAKRLLSQAGGKGEATLVARDEETGLLLKARVDFLAPIVVDGKSTVDARPDLHGFPKQAAYLRYHVQEAFYRRVLTLLKYKFQGFVFLAFEKEEPYAVTTIQLDSKSVEKGADEVTRLLHLYKECKASNNWPSYSDKIEPVTLPTWALKEQPFESSLGYDLVPA